MARVQGMYAAPRSYGSSFSRNKALDTELGEVGDAFMAVLPLPGAALDQQRRVGLASTATGRNRRPLGGLGI